MLTSEILSRHLLGRAEENENFRLNSPCPSRDSNRIPFEYKSDALPLNPADWCLKIAKTSWRKILLEDVIFLQSTFMGGSCSQPLAAKPYLEPDESNPHLLTFSLYVRCSCVIHPPTPSLQRGVMFTSKILYAYQTAPMHATCSHPNFLDLNIVTYDWKLLSSFIRPCRFLALTAKQ